MDKTFVCVWHQHRQPSRPSLWEQQGINGKWHRLCNRCATRRLRNPLNALLPMRLVAPAEEPRR